MSPPHQQPPPQHQPQYYHSSGLSPQNSAAPLIPSHQRPLPEERAADDDGAAEIDPKTGRRRLFGSKKAQDRATLNSADRTRDSTSDQPVMSDTSAAMPGALPQSPLEETPANINTQPIPVSPARHHYSNAMPAPSPSRLRSSSPRMQSPASSEIFERNVQEPVPISTLQSELSPAHIPNHVLTEDHIPAALEASAEAITSENLNPDEVEIVTATSHQPAGASLESSSVADVSSLPGHLPASFVHHPSEGSEPTSLNAASSGFLPPASTVDDDSASNYGALDPNDVRRLSFISFADVVQSEHAHPNTSGDIAGSRDSLHIGSLPSAVHDRTTSPLRSPRSPSSTYSSGGGVITPSPDARPNAPAARAKPRPQHPPRQQPRRRPGGPPRRADHRDDAPSRAQDRQWRSERRAQRKPQPCHQRRGRRGFFQQQAGQESDEYLEGGGGKWKCWDAPRERHGNCSLSLSLFG
ncbi:hypothetical protein Q7P37_009549 [Cladosporium fusiforme]